jgi:hypothetical protein
LFSAGIVKVIVEVEPVYAGFVGLAEIVPVVEVALYPTA